MSAPRLVVAGVASGVGKTTTAVGLIRALRHRGLTVAAFKCGPDYLDPTYLSRAAERPSQNLDGWMMGMDAVLSTFLGASAGADISIIEGVMGLFDGASATSEEGSTAQVAKWLGAPVLLVTDAGGMARSIAALAKGFADFDPELHISGLACNRVGSRGHLELLREALPTPPIWGGLEKRPALAFSERHLGLRTADCKVVPMEQLDAWGAEVSSGFELDTVLAAARAAPTLRAPIELVAVPQQSRCRIGVAFDEAFHFYYADNLRRLEQLGAELVRFSPLSDDALPAVDGLYFGGGYPEVHAPALAANENMRAAIANFAQQNGPVYAECGGLMYLTDGIRAINGDFHAMVGLLPGQAIMTGSRRALGYVEVQTRAPSLLGEAGLHFRGHQFRYSELRDVPDHVERVYIVRQRRTGKEDTDGYQVGSVLGTYIHAHWASNPHLAVGFVHRCIQHKRSST